jgi:6-phosphogluconolactonase
MLYSTIPLAVMAVYRASRQEQHLGRRYRTPEQAFPDCGVAFDPKGRFLVAAGEKSPTISVYAIDQASGALQLLQKYSAGKGANWVEIVGFD